MYESHIQCANVTNTGCHEVMFQFSAQQNSLQKNSKPPSFQVCTHSFSLFAILIYYKYKYPFLIYVQEVMDRHYVCYIGMDIGMDSFMYVMSV